MLIKILVGLGALAFGVVASATPVAAAAATAWQPCQRNAAVDCATVHMPVDWAHPDGPTTGLAVARLKAAKPAQRKGVLMVDQGGPGGSGVSYVESIAGNPRYQALKDSFDIVGFDPRGVGASADIQCDSTVLGEPYESVPTTGDQYRTLLAHNARAAQNCKQLNGPLFDHVDTVGVVRDMDSLRRQLGEAEISYYGVSYGTQIGQQYLELYGQNLRAIVLDSNMDHSIDATRYAVTASLAFENSFRDFASWCQRTATCALHDQDVLALWDKLYAQAEGGALKNPATGGPVTPYALRQTAFTDMYRPARAWFGLADVLKKISVGVPVTPAPRAATQDNSYQAIWCSDWTWPTIDDFHAVTELREKSEAVAPHTHVFEFFSDVSSCLGWTGPLNNPQHVLRPHNAPPILMTNAIHDVATPYDWGLDVSEQLPTATLLTYDGTGHGDYGNSLCAHDAIDAYLLTLKLPPRGTHCPAEWPTAPPTSTFGANTVTPPNTH
ncbi:alpha/beta hydrolase [Kutzneria sp. CA-103260]|uniref:alpha/beta hydrolase n=1 Tax=Kutzneria sp. CA-103260 TaxID=2802641 RepID=UPI001BAB49BA|nr:alpha/beta hydrolase [Kutzneria sp. CA-103260]QUQ62787.1 peptidase/hydrolase [Kutzneria sp. CA-103260]